MKIEFDEWPDDFYSYGEFLSKTDSKFLFKLAILSKEKKPFPSFMEAHGANVVISNLNVLFNLREE